MDSSSLIPVVIIKASLVPKRSNWGENAWYFFGRENQCLAGATVEMPDSHSPARYGEMATVKKLS